MKCMKTRFKNRKTNTYIIYNITDDLLVISRTFLYKIYKNYLLHIITNYNFICIHKPLKIEWNDDEHLKSGRKK